jgi:hypothetical protein
MGVNSASTQTDGELVTQQVSYSFRRIVVDVAAALELSEKAGLDELPQVT